MQYDQNLLKKYNYLYTTNLKYGDHMEITSNHSDHSYILSIFISRGALYGDLKYTFSHIYIYIYSNKFSFVAG